MHRIGWSAMVGILGLLMVGIALIQPTLWSAEENQSHPAEKTSPAEPVKPTESKPAASNTSTVGKEIHVLQVKNMKELQDYMASFTQGLGVDCKFCHDLRGFQNDTEHKKTAREMVLMLNEINSRLDQIKTKLYEGDEAKLKQKLAEKLTCFTCHRGRQEPIRSKAEWEEIQKQETGKK